MDYYNNNLLLQLLKIDTFDEISNILTNKEFINDTVTFLNNFNIDGKRFARIFLSCFVLLIQPDEMIGKNYNDTPLYKSAIQIKNELKNKECSPNHIIKFIELHKEWAEDDIKIFKKDLEKNYRDLLEAHQIASKDNKDKLSKELKNIEKIYFNLTGDIFKNNIPEERDELEYFKDIKESLILLFPFCAEDIERDVNIELYYALDKNNKNIYYKKIVDNIYSYSNKLLNKKFNNINEIISEIINETKKFKKNIELLNKK